VSVFVNDDCLGCGDCTQGICFVDAIQLVNDHAQISENCRGCGQCVDVCPNDAIEISIQAENYVGRAIEHITQLVDVN
jgi:Na+-translocating ferredoxin:NAD+ oxidoreductase RNF subunit RnfB